MEMTVEVDGEIIHSSRALRSPMPGDIVEMVKGASGPEGEADPSDSGDP